MLLQRTRFGSHHPHAASQTFPDRGDPVCASDLFRSQVYVWCTHLYSSGKTSIAMKFKENNLKKIFLRTKSNSSNSRTPDIWGQPDTQDPPRPQTKRKSSVHSISYKAEGCTQHPMETVRKFQWVMNSTCYSALVIAI